MVTCVWQRDNRRGEANYIAFSLSLNACGHSKCGGQLFPFLLLFLFFSLREDDPHVSWKCCTPCQLWVCDPSCPRLLAYAMGTGNMNARLIDWRLAADIYSINSVLQREEMSLSRFSWRELAAVRAFLELCDEHLKGKIDRASRVTKLFRLRESQNHRMGG